MPTLMLYRKEYMIKILMNTIINIAWMCALIFIALPIYLNVLTSTINSLAK